jgi:hypothetical protein
MIVKKFTDADIRSLPDGMKGVYVIYDEDVAAAWTAYIGKSDSCMKKRLLAHYRGRGNSKIKMLVDHRHDLWFSCVEHSNPKLLEAHEILKLALPAANSRYERKPLTEGIMID